MAVEKKSADEVLKEKYEERGWNEMYTWQDNKTSEIEPLPLTEEEYRDFSRLLAKMALNDQNPALCEMYFEMQRRAFYANRYFPIEDLEEEEKEMWSLGTGEVIDNSGPSLH